MATDLYSVISGLEVTPDEILQAEMMAEKILEAKFPDLDLRQGTGLRDLVIRPGATLLALVNKALVYYYSQRSISDVTDSTPTEIVDKVLSNWFMERKAGKKSVVSARLYFATKKNVYVGTESFFSPDNKKKFYPVTSYTIPSGSLTYDSFSGEYFYDIDLSADTEGPDYDLTSGSLLYFSNFDPYFLRGEINYLKEISAVTETNTKFLERAKTAVSTRNLINIPSVKNRIAEDLDYVKVCTPIGFGEEEMMRDLVKVYNPISESGTQIHIGGKTDIYAKLDLQTSVIQFPSNSNGDVLIPGAYYEVSRSTYSGGSSDDTLPKTYEVVVQSLTQSGGVATLTALSHGAVPGSKVAISDAVPSGYNGSHVVTVVNDDVLTFPVDSALAATASGSIKASLPVKFSITYPSYRQVEAAASCVGKTVTVTSESHGVMLGNYVEILGGTPSWYNGWFKVTSATENSFTLENPNGVTGAALGVVYVKLVNPSEDFFLSPRQVTKVSFGPAYASKTVSFEVKGFFGMDSLQEYLVDGSRRVLSSDTLARHYNSYLLDIEVVGYNGPAPSSATCYDVSKSYVDSLAPGEPFIMADLISRFNAAGVGTIQTPVKVSYRFVNKYLATGIAGVILDTLDPEDRTSVFVIDSLVTSNKILGLG